MNKGRNWVFIGMGLLFKICFRSTHVAKQHRFLNTLQFLFVTLSNSRIFFLIFGGHFCLFGIVVRFKNCFWGILILTNQFCFLSFALFLLQHVVLSSCGGGSQQLISFNPTTFLIILLLGCGRCWVVTTCR